MIGTLRTSAAVVFGFCFFAAAFVGIYDFGYKKAVSQFSAEGPIHGDLPEAVDNPQDAVNLRTNAEHSKTVAGSNKFGTKQQQPKNYENQNGVRSSNADSTRPMGTTQSQTIAERRVRTAVVTHLESIPRYKSQFLNLVYPSWTWVNSRRQAFSFSKKSKHEANIIKSMFDYNKKTPEEVRQSIAGDLLEAKVLADLIVFVDTPADELTAMMPPGCHLLATSDATTLPPLSVDDHFAIGPRCFFVETDPSKPTYAAENTSLNAQGAKDVADMNVDVIGFAQQYRFQHSIEFMLSAEFDKVVLSSGWYDFFVRIDTDSILAPGLLRWAPRSQQAAYGGGYFGDPTLTTGWVRAFAKQHQLRSSNTLQGGQSTTYVPTGTPGKAWTHAFVHATALVHSEGFHPADCAKKERDPAWLERQQKYPSDDKPCQWPWWHRGVSSLYGQLMAMEHVFGASPIRTPRVDFPMGATHSGLADAAADMSEVISIHLLELKHQMASELNSCDAFKYPQAIADANNGAGNNARAPRPSVTGEGAKSFARTQPDTSNWKDYCYWFFSRAKARACAGIHSVGY
eukprot:m.761641 g.761641  ORF g.761641 m.761641 type:complete len:569 (-) comp23205_c1_seq37:2234-3940(-)